MVPRAFESLALAAASHNHSREDRLTEIYAVALEEHHGFASRIFKLAHLSPAAHYEAYTQVVLPDGLDRSRLDLKLLGVDEARHPTAILYAEHKEPRGGFQPRQPEKYLPALRAEARSRRADASFLVVVGKGEATGLALPKRTRPRVHKSLQTAEQEATALQAESDALVHAVTWQDIAAQAELAGREAHDGPTESSWREDAQQSDAPAAQRILLELLWYLEEEDYAVTIGLTPAQAEQAAAALAIDNVLTDIIEAAALLVLEPKYGRYKLREPRGGGSGPRTHEFHTSPTSWIHAWGGDLWLAYELDSERGSGSHGQVTFQVGVDIPEAGARILSARPAVTEQLKPFRSDIRNGWIWQQAPVTEFVTGDADEMLGNQAANLAEWAIPQIAALLALRPGRRT